MTQFGKPDTAGFKNQDDLCAFYDHREPGS